MFQHSAARRRLFSTATQPNEKCKFQHSAARRRLDNRLDITPYTKGFNTQPPEGGWKLNNLPKLKRLFQHSAARRRLSGEDKDFDGDGKFQHSAARRRLIGAHVEYMRLTVSTLSRPKAAVAYIVPFQNRKEFQHSAARRRLACRQK